MRIIEPALQEIYYFVVNTRKDYENGEFKLSIGELKGLCKNNSQINSKLKSFQIYIHLEKNTFTIKIN